VNTFKEYSFPLFTTFPAQCADQLTYSFNAFTDASPSVIGQGGTAVQLDTVNKKFIYNYFNYLDLCGTTTAGIDYTITLNADLNGIDQDFA